MKTMIINNISSRLLAVKSGILRLFFSLDSPFWHFLAMMSLTLINPTSFVSLFWKSRTQRSIKSSSCYTSSVPLNDDDGSLTLFVLMRRACWRMMYHTSKWHKMKPEHKVWMWVGLKGKLEKYHLQKGFCASQGHTHMLTQCPYTLVLIWRGIKFQLISYSFPSSSF